MKRVAVFASGEGTNFLNILDKKIEGIEVVLLVTDKLCNALTIADKYSISSKVFLYSKFRNKRLFEEQIYERLKKYKVDYIFLAGYMRLFSPWLVSKYPNKILNIHPSLLPLYKGKNAIEQAWNDTNGKYGVTVHYVNDEMDGGDIILQEELNFEGDSFQSLVDEIHMLEYKLYPKAIELVLKRGDYS